MSRQSKEPWVLEHENPLSQSSVPNAHSSLSTHENDPTSFEHE